MAQSKLCQYFSMIRSREQILLEIRSDPALNARFEALSEEAQKEFLDICTGEKGVKILYDSFFRSVMNPELYPDRLQSMLSCILGMEIASFHVLETSSFALGDVKSLVIMDIVVELLDGSIINLEVQKIGYDFPGERAACYASDLTLRQYARARRDAAKRSAEEPGHKFSYHAIHPVYTIVLIEKSPSLFYRFPDQYIHRFSQKSDTGQMKIYPRNWMHGSRFLVHKNRMKSCVCVTHFRSLRIFTGIFTRSVRTRRMLWGFFQRRLRNWIEIQ